MATEADRREAALAEFRKKLLKHKEVDTKVRSLRETVKELKKDYDKTEDDLKALQSVGQIIGEVLRQLDEERCERPGIGVPAWAPACPRPAAPDRPGCGRGDGAAPDGAAGSGAAGQGRLLAERSAATCPAAAARNCRNAADRRASPTPHPPTPAQSSSRPAAGRATWWRAGTRWTRAS
jgi:hypothetical protein